ncbi:MAG: PilZ domain-containing protein [Thermodesulfovibrionales bacterium]
MEEKRRHKRIRVKGVYGKIYKTLSELNILNLSLGGAAIEVKKSLVAGREYSIIIEDKGKQIELKGTVIWSVPKKAREETITDTEPVYYVGIKFDDVLTDKAAALIDFMDSHKATASKERLMGLRVKIASEKNAVLYDPLGYKVKLISPFGMLIETMQPMNPEDRIPMELFLKDITPFRGRLQGMPDEGVPADIYLKNGKAIRFLGRIVSCTEINESEHGLYDIGVEFLDMHAEDWANLAEFIRSISAEK